MKLPGGERAVVDLGKVQDYCLSSDHPRGRHKARVFAVALGFTSVHAEELRAGLLAAAGSEEATATDQDDYGQRYILDFALMGPGGQAQVRSAWIVRTNEDFPRLTSCYVL